MSATDRSGPRVRLGLTLKIFAASTVLVAVVLLGGLAIASARAARTADAAINRQLAASREAVATLLGTRTATAQGMLRVITLVPAFREILTRPETPQGSFLDQAEEHATTLGASLVMIVSRDGVLLARSDDPEQYGDTLRTRASWVDLALDEGQSASGVMISADSLYQLVSVPILEPASGVVHGVLAAAYSIDDSLAARIERATGSEIVFWELPEEAGAVIRASTLANAAALAPALASPELRAALEADTGAARVDTELDGVRYVGVAGPLRAAHGEVYGGFAVLRSRDTELAAFTALQRTILGAAVAGILLSLVGSLAVARRIARPVRQLAAATQRVQAGDYDVEIGQYGRDEIGTLASAFRDMLEDLREKQALVDYLTTSPASATVRVAGAPSPTAARAAAGTRGRVLDVGEVFADRYEIRSMLGIGGMGVVYLARDRELDEPVAIKTLRPESVDPTLLERFKQEIRLARRITHRNVVRTHDLGEVDGLYYITMEYVEGTSLKELIQKRKRLPVSVILTVGKQLCRALEAAHEQGVIHRDIKPQNIVIEPSGFLKVMDFGIARLAGRPHPPGEGLTAAGMVIGSPEYMAPEQLMGQEIDARADLYAVGAVLFECATGQTPFAAASLMALMAKHIEEAPPDPRSLNPEISPALAAVVLKALSKAPSDRWATAAALHDALDQVATATPHS